MSTAIIQGKYLAVSTEQEIPFKFPAEDNPRWTERQSRNRERRVKKYLQLR